MKLFASPSSSKDEQQRIVGEIEKQFTRLDAGMASLKRVQIALKRYRASVRSEELKHGQHALVPLKLKTQPQRQRQRLLTYRRHEPGSGGFPGQMSIDFLQQLV